MHSISRHVSLPNEGAFGLSPTFHADIPNVERFAQVVRDLCSHLRASAHIWGPNLFTW